MKRGRIVLGIALTIVVALGARAMVRGRHTATPASPARASVPAAERAPDSARVRVQVLNATDITGLARRATMVLRDRGYDVVETGNTKGPLDTTIVLDLSGHADWAQRIAKTLAPARVQARKDTSRYLDIAVVLGAAWRPPAEPFYP
jgi:hypothetical protein